MQFLSNSKQNTELKGRILNIIEFGAVANEKSYNITNRNAINNAIKLA